ncbi:MAG: NAD(P)H-hydrate dehydratase [Nitrososphaeraceae archaeon]
MSSVTTIDPDFLKTFIIPRLLDSRKGDNGTVLIVGGNRIYHGAPILASLSVLRSGADLVYTAVPRSNIIPVRSSSPNIIVLPLADDKLTVGSANRLLAMLPKKPDAAAIGMGLTLAKKEALLTLVKGLQSIGTKLVLDASALIPSILTQIDNTETIVTPHSGEFKRIFGKVVGDTKDERISNVHKTAKLHGITILLKGWIDIVSSSERVAVNTTHNSGMTVGGTGDVLSGLVSGLLSKYSPFEAAVLGVFINGSAGNLALKKLGLHLVATDLISNIPDAMKPFDLVKK